MSGKQSAKGSSTRRGLLARPLEALAFLLPLIIFYEVISVTRHQDRVIAFDLLKRFFELFGHAAAFQDRDVDTDTDCFLWCLGGRTRTCAVDLHFAIN